MTAPAPAPVPSSPVRACVFTRAGRQIAADLGHTREVVVFPDRTVVPGAPPHVLGVANLRGVIVPIVDIGHLLGEPRRLADESARTIVLEDAGTQIAVPADEVLGLESFDEVLPAEPEDGRPPLLGELARGRLRRADGVATLLDVSRLIAAVRVGPPAAWSHTSSAASSARSSARSSE